LGQRWSVPRRGSGRKISRAQKNKPAKPIATALTLGNQFNVKNYGAVGDGHHDDWFAISKAIAAAQSESGDNNAVFFPPGDYLFTGQLQADGVDFIGSQTNNGYPRLILGKNSNSSVILAGNKPQVRFLNFEIKDLNDGDATAIRVAPTATNFVISNNYFGPGFLSSVVINNASQGSVAQKHD
jgi:hypothetical protein